MKQLHIITPVKDAIDTAQDTIRAVVSSDISVPHTYTVYDDFSTPENALLLSQAAYLMNFNLVHLDELTDHPSPNYLLVLQEAQRKALEADAGLCIVESDVTVSSDTLQRLYDEALARPDCGIAAAVTVDEAGKINYPYLYAKGRENQVIDNRKHQSFCCSLLTPELLRRLHTTQPRQGLV